MCLTSKYTLKPLAESHLNPLDAQPTFAGSSSASAPNPIVLLANSCLPQTCSFACCFKLCFHHHPFLFALLGSMKIPRSSPEQSQPKPGQFYPQMVLHSSLSLPTGCQPPLGEAPGAELPTQGFYVFADISLSKLSRERNQLGCPDRAASPLGRARRNPQSGKTPNSAANPTHQQCCYILASPGWHRCFCASRQQSEYF